MKILNSVVPVLMFVPLAGIAQADTEFGDQVPREVVEQFIVDGFNRGPGKLYSDIPDAFPPFSVPADFSVLATADQGFSLRAVLKTDLGEAAARDAIQAALVDAGWQELPDFGAGAPQTGFIGAEAQSLPKQFCNDGFGNLSINVTPGAAPRYVSIGYSSTRPTYNGVPQNCAEQAEMRTQGPMSTRMRASPSLSEYVPRLVIPEGSSTMLPRGIMNGGGSSNDWETEIALTLDWNIEDVAAHFARQVDEQGWMPEELAIHDVLASGTWTKRVDGMRLVGLLLVLRAGEDSWDMKFRVVRVGTSN